MPDDDRRCARRLKQRISCGIGGRRIVSVRLNLSQSPTNPNCFLYDPAVLDQVLRWRMSLVGGSSTPGHGRQGWRRERDSNPRYPFRYAGFQDRCHQPLGHLSTPGTLVSAEGRIADDGREQTRIRKGIDRTQPAVRALGESRAGLQGAVQGASKELD